MYAVVLFTDHDEVEVVPVSWLVASKTKCKWPPLRGVSLTKAIEHRAPPEPRWTTYAVDVLKETESYEKARNKSRKAAENLTDLCTTDDNLKRKSCPPKQLYQSCVEEEPSSLEPVERPGSPDHSEHLEADDIEPLANLARKKVKKVRSLPPLPKGPQPPVAKDGRKTTSLVVTQPGVFSGIGSLRPSPSPCAAKTPSSYDINNSPCSSSSVEKSHTPSRNAITTGPYRGLSLSPPMSKSTRVVVEESVVDIPHHPAERDLKLFTMLEHLKGQMRQHTLLLKSLAKRQVAPPVHDDAMENFTLPLQTEADIERLEETLKDRAKQKVLIF